jgi:DNA topoisomerase IB
MELSQNLLSLLNSMNEAPKATPFDLARLLMADHERVVRAARLQASSTYGSATSRQRHFAWKAAEAKFAASLARVFGGPKG